MSTWLAEAPNLQFDVRGSLEPYQNYARYTDMAAALAVRAVLPLVGSGDKLGIDGAAVDAIGGYLTPLDVKVKNISCEGVKDGAPHLPHGKIYGQPGAPFIGELVADPVEETDHTSKNEAGGRSLIGLVTRLNDKAMHWFGVHYMEKVSVHPEIMERIPGNGSDLLGWMLSDNSRDHLLGVRDMIEKIAKAAGKHPSELDVIALLGKDNQQIRNSHVLEGLKGVAPVTPIKSGDFAVVERSVMSSPENAPVLIGSGGTPEGLLSAMVNPIGFQSVLIATNDVERDILNSNDPEIARYAGKVLGRAELLGKNRDSVLSVGSVTGDPNCSYFKPVVLNGNTMVQVRTYLSSSDGVAVSEKWLGLAGVR